MIKMVIVFKIHLYVLMIVFIYILVTLFETKTGAVNLEGVPVFTYLLQPEHL